MPKNRLSAITDGAVWEKQQEASWNSAVDQVWKDLRGHQEILPLETLGGGNCKDKSNGKVKRRDRDANLFPRPNGLREHAATTLSYGEPGSARKKKGVYQQSAGGEEGAQSCALVATQARVEQNATVEMSTIRGGVERVRGRQEKNRLMWHVEV